MVFVEIKKKTEDDIIALFYYKKRHDSGLRLQKLVRWQYNLGWKFGIGWQVKRSEYTLTNYREYYGKETI